MMRHATGHVQTDDEKQRDLRHAAGLLAQLDVDAQGIAAYDHASHGCPFEDVDGLECPVCDRADAIAMQARAFFGDDATGVR